MTKEKKVVPMEPLFSKALKLFIDEGTVSTTLLQRVFEIGYPRAARMVDYMEEFGYISAPGEDLKRKVLITLEEYNTLFGDDND